MSQLFPLQSKKASENHYTSTQNALMVNLLTNSYGWMVQIRGMPPIQHLTLQLWSVRLEVCVYVTNVDLTLSTPGTSWGCGSLEAWQKHRYPDFDLLHFLHTFKGYTAPRAWPFEPICRVMLHTHSFDTPTRKQPDWNHWNSWFQFPAVQTILGKSTTNPCIGNGRFLFHSSARENRASLI